ncbi:unnamed protein product [Staurois parvus]|uniref:Secreted protein n=1 Tax=Staurois parvus TaxID=386267 RepID=A0ABN9CEJ5_9NEOB|nr:unnamed protein product [Staurois parvus]
MRCVHDLTDQGLLCICCSSALISFLAAISSASWQQSHQLPGSNLISFLAAAISSAHTAPSFSIVQNMAAVSSSCSLKLQL